MENQTSSFQRISNLRNKHFIDQEIEEQNNQIQSTNKMKMDLQKISKSSQYPFLKKSTGVSKLKLSDSSKEFKNKGHGLQSKAKFNNSCGGQQMQIKSFTKQKCKYTYNIIDRKEKTLGDVSKSTQIQKRPSLNRQPFSQKQISGKPKTFQSKWFNQQRTLPYTLYNSLEIIQEQVGRQYLTKGNNSTHSIPLDFNRRESQKQLFKKKRTNIQDFKLLKRIGKGIQGQVHLAVYKELGVIFALKIIYKNYLKDQKNRQNFLRQIKIHLSINDRNIIKLYHVFNDRQNFYLVLQPMVQGDLYNILKKQRYLSEKHASKLILNICKGVKALHQKNILHRDLKLQNILLTQGKAKIGDFGCAVSSVCMRKSAIGSLSYLSPQQMANHFYNKKIDIWSIGVITYQLLFGQSPFSKEIQKSLLNHQQIPQFELIFPKHIEISQDGKNFICKCLQKNSNNRMNILQALDHPFINIKNNKNILI